MTGAADRVGFLSKSNSISTSRIQLLMGAWEALGFMVRFAYTLLCQFSLIKFYQLDTIKSKASKSSYSFIRSLLSILSIYLKRAMNQLLKLYCPMIVSNRYSSLPGFSLDWCSPCSLFSMLSSGNNLQSSQMQFILVLAANKGRPRISSLISSPAANTRERSSMSLLVRTYSGEEQRKSCSSTRSNLLRSRLPNASICATLMLRKLLETKRELGLSSRGRILASVRCVIIWMRVRLILKMSSFWSSPRITIQRLRSRLSKIQQKLESSFTIYRMLATSLALQLFMREMFLFLSTSSHVASLCNFLTVTASRDSVFSALKNENHFVLMIRSNNRYFSIKQFYYQRHKLNAIMRMVSTVSLVRSIQVDRGYLINKYLFTNGLYLRLLSYASYSFGSHWYNLKIEKVVSSPVPVCYKGVGIWLSSSIQEASAGDTLYDHISIFSSVHDAPLQVGIILRGSVSHESLLTRLASSIKPAVRRNTSNAVELPTRYDNPLEVVVSMRISVSQENY